MLNSFLYLFVKRFRNYLGLLFHTTQSLILFALQILFAMLRATSSFGLRPHSTQNPLSWIIVSRLQVIHFVLLRKTIVYFSALLRRSLVSLGQLLSQNNTFLGLFGRAKHYIHF